MEKECCESVKADRLVYIEYFRGIAILFIVLCHTVCFGRSTMLQTNALFFAAWQMFFQVFFITIAALVVLRFILKKLGIKNTRMLIGV